MRTALAVMVQRCDHEDLATRGEVVPTFGPGMFYPLLFDISGGELIVVLLFVLLFFGSKGIPDIARTLGRSMRQMRDASNEVQREIQRNTHDVRRAMEEQRRAFQKEQKEENDSPVPPVQSAGPPDPELPH